VISQALERVIFAEQFPRTTIDVYLEVLQAEAGTRCAALTVASVALADAGIPMKTLVPSCAAGKINGQVVLDLGKQEDNKGEADLPIAIIPQTDEIVLLQMDGHFTPEEFREARDMAIKACHDIYKLQRDALTRRYAIEMMGTSEGEE